MEGAESVRSVVWITCVWVYIEQVLWSEFVLRGVEILYEEAEDDIDSCGG